MANMKLLCMVVLFMVLAAPFTTEAGLTCSQINSQLSSCITFLVKGGNPLPKCCTGIRYVVSASKTTPDRQSACKCLKSTAGGIKGINPKNAASLPGICKVNIPYKISPNTDCSTVK